MPGEGLEPSWISPRDFESRASTNFAITAGGGKDEEDSKTTPKANAFNGGE